MRIYAGQATSFFPAAAINQSVNRNRMDHGQQALPAILTPMMRFTTRFAVFGRVTAMWSRR